MNRRARVARFVSEKPNTFTHTNAGRKRLDYSKRSTMIVRPRTSPFSIKPSI